MRTQRSTGRIQRRHEVLASETELRMLMKHEIEDTKQRELVMVAGHFMLFADNECGHLVPGIIDMQSNETMRQRISNRVGIFPSYTWQVGVELAREWTDRFSDIKFLLLINDWQYVPNQGGSAPEMRKRFFESFTRLPQHYQEVLAQDGVFSMENIMSSRKHPIAFPETWLKYRFQKSAARLVKQGKLAKHMLDTVRNDSEVSFLDSDGNYRSLITCGVTGCAGEVTELVAEVYKAGRRLMVAFVPGECMQPVRTGVEVALELYDLKGMKVVIVDPGGSGELSVDEIYGKMVNFMVLEHLNV